MITIHENMNSGEFVNALNTNFSQSGGGSSSSASHTVKMQLQGGQLVSGYTGMTGTDSVFFQNCHTILMLGIEECTITNVATESGETLTIVCYDANGAFISNVTAISNIPSGTCYVKFMLTKSTNYASLRQLSVTVSGKPSFRKNSTPTLVAKKLFSFETSYPDYFDTTNNSASETMESRANSYMGMNNSTRYYDNGFIELPPNYDPDGAPVPLVIYVHGTDGWNGFTTGTLAKYDDLMNFIVNNGYALCDCIGLTNAHKSDNTNKKENDIFYGPGFITCINNLVKYINANYNVCDDGVYIYSKSSGGFTLHALTQMQGLRIRAAASLAPAISVIGNLHYNVYDEFYAVNLVCQQLGIDQMNSAWKSTTLNQNLVTAIVNNIHEWRQVDPLFLGADISDAELATLTQQLYSDSSATFGASATKRDFSKSSTCMATLNERRLVVTVPTKIWIAADDDRVPYGTAKLYVDMAQRTGSPVYLRRMPSGTGKHYSVDADANAVKVTYQTKYAGSVSVPMAYAEMVDWFNRF